MSQFGLFPDKAVEGKIIGGKYRLGKKLSEGGGGIVWQAVNQGEEEIALKFLKWSPLKSRKNAAERFKNEFTILKSLSHPNISRIYDFGFDQDVDQYYFTSELLTEGDLRSLVKAPIPEIEDLLLQALRALEYLGNHRLLHLDIKPQNLLLRAGADCPMLALIDFGLATFRPPDRPGGTANYMSPELVVRRLELKNPFPEPDARSDLYSLGVTFYYCLTGFQPFCAKGEPGNGRSINPEATLINHLNIDPPPPSAHRQEIPPYLDRMIMKLMARDPNERYASANIAAQALIYSSPRHHAPESRQSLLAYLPREGKIIGRQEEISEIEKSIHTAVTGEGGGSPMICIAGGRGTGRTRLLMAAKPAAQRMEMEVFLIRPDGPGVEIPLDNKKPCALLIDDIDRIMCEDFPNKEDLIGGLKSFIKKVCLQRRLSSESKSRSLLVFTLSTDRSEPKGILSKLGIDSPACHTLNIANFSNDEISAYLATLLGERPDAAVTEHLKRCTGGNPLFITEHLQEMIAKGNIFSLAGRPDAKTLRTIGIDFSQIPPPRSLEKTILGELSRLPEEGKNLVLALACWHRPASADELLSTCISECDESDLLALTGMGIICRNSGDGRFMFADLLTHRIVRSNSARSELAAMHDRIAEHLSKAKGKKPDDMLLHMAYGSRSPQTIPALRRLAAGSFSTKRPLEAAEHLKYLLKQIPHDDWKAKADILAQIGSAYERMSFYDDAKKFYRSLAKVSVPSKIGIEAKLRSAEHLGRMEIRRRNLKEARRIFTEALKLQSGKKALSVWRLRVENFLAGIDMRDGRVEDAVDRFLKTDSVAKKILTKPERLQIDNNELGEALLRSGNASQALKILRQELKLAQQADDVDRMASRYYLIANALRNESPDNCEEANAHYLEALKFAKAGRMLGLQVRIHNGLGNLHLQTSDPKRAMQNYREGFRLSQQVDSLTTSVELMIGMGLAAQRMGNPDETIEYFEAALDFSGGPKGEAAGLIRRYRPTIYISLGDAYYQKKNFQSAMEYLEKASEIDRESPLTPDLRYSLYGTMTDIMIKYEDYDAAAKHLPTLRAIVKAFPPATEHLDRITEVIEGHKNYSPG